MSRSHAHRVPRDRGRVVCLPVLNLQERTPVLMNAAAARALGLADRAAATSLLLTRWSLGNQSSDPLSDRVLTESQGFQGAKC
jgi:hypothetical protein